MREGFYPVLLKSRLSAQYLNPGEALWVTLWWQNQGNAAASEDYLFFLDGTYGHQRRPENRQFDFRVTQKARPGTSLWTPGRRVAVTLKWDVGCEWAGTYKLRIGMLDREGVPILFQGTEEACVRSHGIGDVDTGWNFGRPWVAEHRHPVEKLYGGEAELGIKAEPGWEAGNIQACATEEDGIKFCGTGIKTFRENEDTDTIFISDGITLVLGENRPVLKGIRDGKHHRIFTCAVPVPVLRDRESSRVYREGEGGCRAVWSRVSAGSGSAVYHGAVSAGKRLAAAFDVTWELKGRSAYVTLKNRQEYNGFELLELGYDTLAELESGMLLDFWGSGREVPIPDSIPAFFEKRYDVRNAAALYDEQMLILVESCHLDSRLVTGLLEADGRKCGFIGGTIVSRVKAEGKIASIPVKHAPVFEITVPDMEGRKPSWQDAARCWQEGLQPAPAAELYRNAYFYKQLATWGPLPAERWRMDRAVTTRNLFRRVTFDEICRKAGNFARLTDDARQILYIAGWQKGGFDDAYPYPYDAEERCGGMEGLRRCLEEARKYHVLTGLHDNFDDVSEREAERFPYTALDENGDKWRGWVWAAGMTYIMGLRKYVDSGAAAERVERMCELLPLKNTYHLDVLTAEVCRYDYDPENPASAQDSHEAKLDIIELFNRHGLDVTSEVLTHPFVGKVGFALHNRVDTDGEFLPGSHFVPLVQRIYHGIIGYCAPGRTRQELLWGILLGGQSFYEEDIDGELCVSRYYLQNVPAMYLYGRRMLDFRKVGERAVAVYEGDCRVEADFAGERYSVVAGGRVIAKDFTTFAEGNHEGVWLAYSMDGGEMRYPVPEKFAAAGALTAHMLTVTGEGEPVEVRIQGRDVILMMPAMTPVRVCVN